MSKELEIALAELQQELAALKTAYRLQHDRADQYKAWYQEVAAELREWLNGTLPWTGELPEPEYTKEPTECLVEATLTSTVKKGA